MVRYSRHVLKSKLIVCYSNAKKLGNQMAFGYQTFYHGRKSNGPDHSIINHLNNEQVKVRYSDKFAFQMCIVL